MSKHIHFDSIPISAYAMCQKSRKAECERRVAMSLITNDRDKTTCPDCLEKLRECDVTMGKLLSEQKRLGLDPINLSHMPWVRPVDAA